MTQQVLSYWLGAEIQSSEDLFLSQPGRDIWCISESTSMTPAYESDETYESLLTRENVSKTIVAQLIA